jgi:hypothetical protein
MATKRAGSQEEVFPVIYGELRRVARRYLARALNHTPSRRRSSSKPGCASRTNAAPSGRGERIPALAHRRGRLPSIAGAIRSARNGWGAQNVVLTTTRLLPAAVPIEDLDAEAA